MSISDVKTYLGVKVEHILRNVMHRQKLTTSLIVKTKHGKSRKRASSKEKVSQDKDVYESYRIVVKGKSVGPWKL